VTARRRRRSFLVPVVLSLLVGGLGYLGYLIVTDKGGVRKTTFQNVTLVRPQDVKEKPPEPEPPKEAPKPVEDVRQMIEAPTIATQAAQPGPAEPGPAAGADLGVDAEGGSGSDAFGLVGRKGGRSVTLGGGSGAAGGEGGSLRALYGTYAKRIQDDVRESVRKILEGNGARPRGKRYVTVQISLDGDGIVLRRKLVGPSGDTILDEAVLKSLNRMKISEPPPQGMPRTLTLRIVAQG
jgi:TonB family protein